MMNIQRLSHDSNEHLFQKLLFVKEYMENDFPYNNLPHRHEFYQLIFITEGTGDHIIEGCSFPLKNNYLFLISENQTHYFKNVNSISGYIIGFDKSLLDSIKKFSPYTLNVFNSSLLINTLVVDKDEIGIRRSLTVISEEFKQSYFPSQFEVLSVLLQSLLIKIQSIRDCMLDFRNVNYSFDYDRFNQFLTLLENDFTKIYDVQYYSNLLGISSRKLTSITSKYSGRTAKNLIIYRRIIEAKKMLVFGNDPMKIIAVKLGFSDQFQFTKFFKKNIGLSPNDFRKQSNKL